MHVTRRTLGIAVGVAAATLAIAVPTIVYANSGSQKPSASVPAVVGLSGEAAAAKINEAGLRYYADLNRLASPPSGGGLEVNMPFPPDQGYVISQSPAPGTPMDRSGIVGIVLDTKPPQGAQPQSRK